MSLTKNFKIEIDFEKCKGCYLCIDNCNKNNIEISKESNKLGYFPAQIKRDYDCNGCGNCYEVCGDNAIKIKKNNRKYKNNG